MESIKEILNKDDISSFLKNNNFEQFSSRIYRKKSYDLLKDDMYYFEKNPKILFLKVHDELYIII
jgi:hypothetical protein